MPHWNSRLAFQIGPLNPLLRLKSDSGKLENEASLRPLFRAPHAAQTPKVQ